MMALKVIYWYIPTLSIQIQISDPFIISAGTTQGSALSPLLNSLYVPNIPSNLQYASKIKTPTIDTSLTISPFWHSGKG